MAPTNAPTNAPTSTDSGGSVMETTTADNTVVIKQSTPASTIILAAIIGLLVVTLFAVGGVWLYRRRGKNEKSAPSASFDKDAFTIEKKGGLDRHLAADLTNHLPFARHTGGPREYRASTASSTDSETTLWRAPSSATSAFHVRNGNVHGEGDASTLSDVGYSSPTLPKAVGEKGANKTRGKPMWMQPIIAPSMDEMAMLASPPPSYGMANRVDAVAPVSVPPLALSKKGKQTSQILKSPSDQRSFASLKADKKREKDAEAAAQYLTVQQSKEDILPVVSPARSESFAPKEGIIFSPPEAWLSPAFKSPNSALGLDSSSPSSPPDSAGARSPRLMNVVKPFIATLPDELRVKVGDTVRVLQTYKDGWCFAQFVGKADAPKGVVPLVCLQERQRFVPFRQNSSNSSITSLTWR